MKNFIMGTAGHVDHGKTALIKALTNIDCDTHPEEKKRGITINLGFAHLKLTEDIKIGIVDVPGHKDFVNTMVAGASGIDFVLFVIAGDSGIMPQTIEHLKIMELLGIKKGLVVITKIDLVEKEFLDMMRVEVRKFLSNTFLESAEILEVSATSNIGISKLIESIKAMVNKIERVKSSSNFRMFIDRAFTMKGHGSVVTGSSLGGELKYGENVWILPQEREIRVRRIEQYGREVECINEISRLSLNLVGLKLSELKRGALVSKNFIKPTHMFDAKISLFQKNKSLGIWSNAIILIGTLQNHGRIHLIDKNTLKSGETAIVQIHFSEPGIVLRGDKFIFRNTSGEITLGGGKVIDAYPLHHKRRPKKLIEDLNKISEGGIIEFAENEIDKSEFFIRLDYLSQILNIEKDALLNEINAQSVISIIIIGHSEDQYLMKKTAYELLIERILKSIKVFHKKQPLASEGMGLEEICRNLNIKLNNDKENFFKHILNNLLKENKLKQIDNTWALSEHRVVLTETDKQNIKFVNNYFLNSKMHVPVSAELKDIQKDLHIAEGRFRQILNFLSLKKQLYYFEGSYVHADIVDENRIKLLRYLLQNSDGITVAKFRDLIGGNRKICIFLMNIYDSEGVTHREGDLRRITKEGEIYLRNYE